VAHAVKGTQDRILEMEHVFAQFLQQVGLDRTRVRRIDEIVQYLDSIIRLSSKAGATWKI
jgi:hypothetical protein